MRTEDEALHPKALERAEQARLEHMAALKRTYGGIVIAASGLAVIFLWQEFYIGFTMALIGTGLVPFDKLVAILRGRVG